MSDGQLAHGRAPAAISPYLGMTQPLLASSIITCPVCVARTEEVMPTNACQFFYECPHCGSVLRPLAGDCCVYCSYGTVPCPPMQQGDCCASDAPAE